MMHRLVTHPQHGLPTISSEFLTKKKLNCSMKRLFAVALLLLVLPLSSHAWWDKEWTGRKKITLDSQAAGITSDAVSVPVLVRLSSANFDFLAGKDDGSDLRFVAEDDKTPLPFHIERFDQINELGFVWVQVPKLAGNNTGQHIWLYYGNTKVADVKEAKKRFDEAQLAVYHLGETEGAAQDATGAGNHASASGMVAVSAGLIGGSSRLGGSGGLELSNPALQSAKEITVSAWINPDNASGELISFGTLSVSLADGVPTLGANGATARGGEALSPKTWHHIAVTAGQAYTLYVDGKQVALLPGALATAAQLRVGGGLNGLMDEVQVSTIARPAAWLMAQVQSQSEAGKLVKQGEEQTTDTSEGPNYFRATLQNLTVDGWVVVGICVLMFVVAIWIMATKVILLNRIQKTNEKFNDVFGSATRDLRTLGNDAGAHADMLNKLTARDGDFGNASLHRIFKVGVLELLARFPGTLAGHPLPSLSAQAMSAVRASLDAQLVRERQRLDQGMVLLTIAISGGPFLGLLGTVVGVMITFAAIAAAGDVNVNAIAPGIAAALVATVAGLGVAIPALFGYNYLMTRIKSVSADMNVFVDEFVTKMAENYGG
jgi:biopolymer transport protein ExbB